MLFGYGEEARFRLDPRRAHLDCVPGDTPELAWQRVLVSRILPNLSLLCGREALHASAAESPLGAVLIAGPSGSGKSTLAAELVGRGWPLFSDDVVVLENVDGAVRAYPGTPHMNLASAAEERLGSLVGELGGESWVAIHECTGAARGVAAVFLLEREAGLALEVEPLPASPLTLAPFMLGRAHGPEPEDRRFALYSDLVGAARLFRLRAGIEDEPGALAEAIEAALALHPAAAIGGAS